MSNFSVTMDPFGVIFRTDSEDAAEQLRVTVQTNIMPMIGTLHGVIHTMPSEITNHSITTVMKKLYETALRDPSAMAKLMLQYNNILYDQPTDPPTPPLLFLACINDQIELCHSLSAVPDSVGSEASACRGKTILCIGELNTSNPDAPWDFINLPEDLFQPRPGKLGPPSALDVSLDGELGHNELSANDTTLADQGPDDIAFLPVLFLHSKDICYKVYQGLYPDSTTPRWTPQQLGWDLRTYIASITHESTKDQMQRSLMGFLTASGASGSKMTYH